MVSLLCCSKAIRQAQGAESRRLGLALVAGGGGDGGGLHGGSETRLIPLQPRMLCGNFGMLLAAARQGLGVALLPMHVCQPSFESGELVHALPNWHTPYGMIQAVFSSRKGLVPAVRALIDYLVEEVPARAAPSGTVGT